MKTTPAQRFLQKLKTSRFADLLAGRRVTTPIEHTIGLDELLECRVSIAVVPFGSLDQNDDQLYFGEGMAEEILNALSKVVGLRVTSRSASFQFTESQDIRETGFKLGVDSILCGQIRKSAEGFTVAVQLHDAQDGQRMWSEDFSGKTNEIGEVQNIIAGKVTRFLGLVMPEESGVDPLPVERKAYDFFLRGLSYFSRHTTQDIVYARQMLKQAIEIEPDYGRAWAGVAYTHGFEYMYFNASNVNLAEIQRTAAKALKLAPRLAQSHVAAGIAACMSRDYPSADRAFTRAIRLNPFNFHAWYFFGRAKVHEGDLVRALNLFDCASRIRPEDFQSVLLQAQLHISLDREDQAIHVTNEGITRVRKALELNPGDNRALNLGAFALLRLGEEEEAVHWMSRSLQSAPMDSIIQYNGACFFSLAGKPTRALDCLENCLIKVGNINRKWLLHDSDMDNIRNHPRFTEIIKTFPE